MQYEYKPRAPVAWIIRMIQDEGSIVIPVLVDKPGPALVLVRKKFEYQPRSSQLLEARFHQNEYGAMLHEIVRNVLEQCRRTAARRRLELQARAAAEEIAGVEPEDENPDVPAGHENPKVNLRTKCASAGCGHTRGSHCLDIKVHWPNRSWCIRGIYLHHAAL